LIPSYRLPRLKAPVTTNVVPKNLDRIPVAVPPAGDRCERKSR
jgi:hypothetical protein